MCLPPVGKMVRMLLLILVLLLLPSFAWAKHFYVDNMCSYNGDGTTQACAAGDGQPGPFNSIAKAQTALTGDQSDNSLLLKRDRIFREQYNVSAYGTESHPFTIGGYGAGNIPIISGADLLDRWSKWTKEGVLNGADNRAPAKRLWYTTVSGDPKQVFINGSRATEVSSKDDLDKVDKWCFDRKNNRIYVYSVSHPSTRRIEVSSRFCGIYIKGKRYLKFQNLQVEKTNGDGFRVEGDSHYITLENVVSNENYNTGMDVNTTGYTCTGGKVQNSTCSLNGGSGLKLSYAASWTITQNNTSNNCQLRTGKEAHNWAAGIKITATNSANNIIEKNISSGNKNGCGIWLDFCGAGNVIRYNWTEGNYSAGIFNEITSGTKIYYNVSCNNTSGIYVEGRSTPIPPYPWANYPANNNEVYNNVMWGNSKFGFILQQGQIPYATGYCHDNIVKNNISVNTTDGPNLRVGGAAEYEKNTFSNNCFGKESTKFIEWGWGSYRSSYDAWEKAYGSSTNSVKADPKMVDPSNRNFRLKPTSPCIDAGTDVGLTQDHTGVRLPIGRAPDIGAYVYSGD